MAGAPRPPMPGAVTRRGPAARAAGRLNPAALPLLLLVFGAAWWIGSRATIPETTPLPDLPAPAAGHRPQARGSEAAARTDVLQVGDPRTVDARVARQGELALWQQRLARAQTTLAAYRTHTRYPFDSRPAREHLDQFDPHAPIEEDKPLRLPGAAPIAGVHLHTTQDRVFASGDEPARFTVAALDDDGHPLPLHVLRAVAWAPEARGPGAAPVIALPFVDDGSGGDARAGDGVLTGVLRPATQGFADLPGLIRTELTVQVGDQSGFVAFDVVWSPGNAARWTGGAREAIENGSLVFHLGLQVQQAGRYVIAGRVVDAAGQPVALLNFNDTLAPGAREVRLTVFGRLVRDLKPVFPLTLRDVTGFLLRADTYPDRILLPSLDGPVITSRRHPLIAFGDAEWASEERSRYLTEYGKDVAEAQTQVRRLGGGP